ncbi:MAG: SDR family oxidoreductase [Bdellovibrionia bacterium]
MSLYARFKRNGPSGFGYSSTAEEVTQEMDLSGKTILVTGCNSGLGEETVRVLALRGAHVLSSARTLEKAQQTISRMGLLPGRITPLSCELSEPSSVMQCVSSIQKMNLKLDAIICNAGIMALPQLKTAYGLELQFFTNHIGHFLLVTRLLDQLSPAARVVMLSSRAHENAPAGGIQFDNLSGQKGYQAWSAYGQSKMANLLFAKELSRKFAGTQKTANAVHPGVIYTNLGRNMKVAEFLFSVASPLFLKSIAQGAATSCYVATHPQAAKITGEYFVDCNVSKPRADALNLELSQRLWEESEKIVTRLLA